MNNNSQTIYCVSNFYTRYAKLIGVQVLKIFILKIYNILYPEYYKIDTFRYPADYEY